MVGSVIGICVWQVFCVFELKYNYCYTITQIHYLEKHLFIVFSY